MGFEDEAEQSKGAALPLDMTDIAQQFRVPSGTDTASMV